MPNLAASLKSEIARIARKEVRAETASLKKAATAHRSEIAALRKRNQVLEAQLRRLHRSGRPQASPLESADPPKPSPIGADSLKALRRKFGLSVHDLGRLVGASTQSIYNWESGKARPQARYLNVLAFVKDRTKAEVVARLSALGA
jgi:DNA-binding transcriptional regulator YiaG